MIINKKGSFALNNRHNSTMHTLYLCAYTEHTCTHTCKHTNGIVKCLTIPTYTCGLVGMRLHTHTHTHTHTQHPCSLSLSLSLPYIIMVAFKHPLGAFLLIKTDNFTNLMYVVVLVGEDKVRIDSGVYKYNYNTCDVCVP